MATDEILRVELRKKGTKRLQDFSVERTARAYRAVYRKAAGFALSTAEENLLKRGT